MKRLTLEEIGRLAGVSRSTVSRVINEQPDVSPEVKKRVLDVIDETGYQPNRAARSLVSSRTDLLGLVIPSSVHNLFADPYFGRLIRGITSAANAAHQTLSLFLFEDEREELELYGRAVASGLVDGMIITATRMGDPLAQRLRDGRLPFVMVGRPDADDIPHVDVDNQAGARLATEHLIGHGYERIGTIAAPSNTTTGVDRRTGFLDAMRAAGRAVKSPLIAEGDFTVESGRFAMDRLLSQQPDAVFCASDTMAAGAMQALEAAGVRVPDDIAIIGFDGILDPSATDPSLTTISQPVRATGERAVNRLLELLDDGTSSPVRTVLPTELITRRSCGCEEAAA